MLHKLGKRAKFAGVSLIVALSQLGFVAAMPQTASASTCAISGATTISFTDKNGKPRAACAKAVRSNIITQPGYFYMEMWVQETVDNWAPLDSAYANGTVWVGGVGYANTARDYNSVDNLNKNGRIKLKLVGTDVFTYIYFSNDNSYRFVPYSTQWVLN